MRLKTVKVKEEDVDIVEIYRFEVVCPKCKKENFIEAEGYQPDEIKCNYCTAKFKVKYVDE